MCSVSAKSPTRSSIFDTCSPSSVTYSNALFPPSGARGLISRCVSCTRRLRYITPFLKRSNLWERTLTDLQDIIDNWLKVQGVWLYLEPIFSSPDINKQMPKEGEMFKQVDNTWRTSMARVGAGQKAEAALPTFQSE